MCEHCEQLKDQTDAIFQQVMEDDELDAFFQPAGSGDGPVVASGLPESEWGWMAPDPVVSDKVLSVFERLLTAIHDWAVAKGQPNRFAESSPVPMPPNVGLAIIRELQIHRAMYALSDADMGQSALERWLSDN